MLSYENFLAKANKTNKPILVCKVRHEGITRNIYARRSYELDVESSQIYDIILYYVDRKESKYDAVLYSKESTDYFNASIEYIKELIIKYDCFKYCTFEIYRSYSLNCGGIVGFQIGGALKVSPTCNMSSERISLITDFGISEGKYIGYIVNITADKKYAVKPIATLNISNSHKFIDNYMGLSNYFIGGYFNSHYRDIKNIFNVDSKDTLCFYELVKRYPVDKFFRNLNKVPAPKNIKELEESSINTLQTEMMNFVESFNAKFKNNFDNPFLSKRLEFVAFSEYIEAVKRRYMRLSKAGLIDTLDNPTFIDLVNVTETYFANHPAINPETNEPYPICEIFEEDIEELIKHYRKMGPRSSLYYHLYYYGRLHYHYTRISLEKFGNRMRLKHNRNWTEEEDDIIRKYYPLEGCEVWMRLYGRSEDACRARANKLDVKSRRFE